MSTVVSQPHGNVTKQFDQFLTPHQQEQMKFYRRLQADAERRGWSPASVINLHPFTRPVTGPVHQVDIRIPAIPLNEEHWMAAPKLKLASGLEIPYAQYVFAQWKPLQQKYVTGQLEYEEVNDSGHIWPIDQAQDAVKQSSLSADMGGVFCYEGDHQPCSENGRKKDHLELVAVEREMLEVAHRKQMAYYQTEYEKFADAWAGRNSTNSWKDLAGKGKYHRWIAMYMYRVGSLRALPAWYEEISQPGALKQPKCDQCQQNVEQGAVLCRHCGRVLLPFEAFDRLMIDGETPGAKLAAKRLSDRELGMLMKSGKLEQQQLADWGIITIKEKKGKQAD